MKRTIVCILVLWPAVAHAQHGTVIYGHFQQADSAAVAAFNAIEGASELMEVVPMPPDSFPHILTFSSGASLMRIDSLFADSIHAANNPMKFMQELMGKVELHEVMEIWKAMMPLLKLDQINAADLPPKATYVDFENGTYIQQRPMVNLYNMPEPGSARVRLPPPGSAPNVDLNTYLVSGALQPIAWTVEETSRTILGHAVLRATATVDSAAVEAWFAADIEVPAGPLLYGGLPGLILELSLDDGAHRYLAVAVDLHPVPSITPPAKGVNVTAEEYERVVLLKNEELRRGFEMMQRMF